MAALIVVLYHIFEGFAASPQTQIVNHGYLAVDFFFLLSGFVIGYAYDDRWQKREFTLRSYFKRRLIRLHPMVVLGAVIGALSFLMQGGVKWDGTPVSSGWVFFALLLTMLMIPAYPRAPYEVRGNGEIFPLNGPSWSLFFEYLGNILYALLLRKLSTNALKWLVAATGTALFWFAFSDQSGTGGLGVGWSMAGTGFLGGSLRLLFSYSAGLLISRVFKPLKIRQGFWISTLALLILLPMPYLEHPILNGLYDTALIVAVFPLLLWLAASEMGDSVKKERVYTFLGDLSYPLYMSHYPLMYLFYAWLWREGLTISEAWPAAVGVYLGSLVLGFVVWRFYDLPVRKILAKL